MLSSIALVVTAAFQPLASAHAEASSFLSSNWNKYEENYHPSYVLDDDPKTAWVEGAEGDGKGEWILLPLSTVSTARRLKLVVKNGYQKTPALLAANGAPGAVTVVVIDAAGHERLRQPATLARTMGAQDIIVDLGAAGAHGVSGVKIVIDSVIAGSTYNDTCISDIGVFVDSDVPYNAKAEAAKKQALLAWRSERLETAAYFAKLPPTYPWASTRFESAIERLAAGPWHDDAGRPERVLFSVVALIAANDRRIAALDDDDRADFARLAAFRDGGAPAGAVVRRIDPLRHRVPVPDGVPPASFTAIWAPVVRRDALVMAEPSPKSTGRADSESGRDLPGEHWVVSDAAVVGDDVFFTVRRDELNRVGTIAHEQWLLRYRAGQLVRALWLRKEVTPDDRRTEPGEAFGRIALHANADGKVDVVDVINGGIDCQYRGDEVVRGVADGDCAFIVRRLRSTALLQGTTKTH